jgi:hypothetical protein
MKIQVKSALKSLRGSFGRALLLVLPVVLVSCSKDDKKDVEVHDATAVAGTYVGPLTNVDEDSFGNLTLTIEATKADSIVIRTNIDLSEATHIPEFSLPVVCPAKVTFVNDHYVVSGSTEVTVPIPNFPTAMALQVQIAGTITAGEVKTATLTITPSIAAIPEMELGQYTYVGVKSE